MNERKERTLFLAWQNKHDRQWFPIGRLDADVDRRRYRFRYIGGVKKAQETQGSRPCGSSPIWREITSRPICSRCSGTVSSRQDDDQYGFSAAGFVGRQLDRRRTS